MSPETRSAVMSRIRGKGTLPERLVGNAFLQQGLIWESHARDLRGCPDFVFREERVLVFVDGDFWHGWRFPEWRDKLSEAWEAKIEKNRSRDQRNFRHHRRNGWVVVRLWEHQIHKDLEAAIRKVLVALGHSS